MELQCWSIWLATRRQSRRGGGWRGLKSLLMSSSGSGGSPLTCLCWFSCCCGQNKHTPVSNTLSAGFPVAVHSTITRQSVIPCLCWFSCCCAQHNHTPVSNTVSDGCHAVVDRTIKPQSVPLLAGSACWQQYPNSMDISKKKTCT